MFGKKHKKTNTKKPASAPRRGKSAARQGSPSRLVMWWRALQPRRRQEIRRGLTWSAVVVSVGLCLIAGLGAMARSVLARPASTPVHMRVEIVNAPTWMPGLLRRHLEASLVPAQERTYDPDLPRKVYLRAMASPWIQSVRNVRRCTSDKPGTVLLQLRASFRKPIARIHSGNAFAYLDARGVRLPASQAPRWVGTAPGPDGRSRQICFANADEVPPRMRVRPVHYFAIDGVRTAEPPIGEVWTGPDVEAGLRLLALIADKPYANQITLVDVRNHDGRISRHEPHLKLYAQVGSGRATDIKFGRFPRPRGDFVVAPARKVSYLDEYVARNGGRLAGLNAHLDLRNDNLHVSIE